MEYWCPLIFAARAITQAKQYNPFGSSFLIWYNLHLDRGYFDKLSRSEVSAIRFSISVEFACIAHLSTSSVVVH
jgi:hypothetical protein